MPDHDLNPPAAPARPGLCPALGLVWSLGSLLSAPSALAQTAANTLTRPSTIRSSAATVTTSSTSINGGEKIEVKAHKSANAVLGDARPIMRIQADEIRSYGVDTAADLLTAIAPETRSGRGATGNTPVVLLNGKRISGMQDVNDLPFEAIARVEIFTEEEALRYGYPADERVVNIITVKHFRALRMRAYGSTSTDGGGDDGVLGASFTKLSGERRINLSARYEAQARLLDSDRGVTPPSASSLYSNAGNVTSTDGGSLDPALDALVGQSVTSAGVPSLASRQIPTLQDFTTYANAPHVSSDASDYSLQPGTHELKLNGVYADQIFRSVSASFNASYTHSNSESLQGPARGILTLPSGSLYSPFSQDTLLYRDYTNVSALQQRSHTESVHAGLNFNGDAGNWKWNSTGSFDRSITATNSQTGLDLSAAQTALTAGLTDFDPFSEVDRSWLNSRLVNQGHTTGTTGRISGLVSGPLFSLPAGDVSTSIAPTGTLTEQNATSINQGKLQRTHISRYVGTLQINGDIPVASARKHVLSFLGKLDANVNGAVSQVSHFGTLGTIGGGVTWEPVSWVQFPFSVTDRTEAPSATSLVAPQIETPNVTTYDYVTGRSVQVTTISGGNRNLRAADRHEISIGTILSPTFLDGARLHVNYVRDRNHNPVMSLPTATAAIEEAFPDRYQRNSDGILNVVDIRPVNALMEKRNEWNATFSFSRPLGKKPEGKGGKHGAGGRYYIVLTQVWRLKDTVQLRSGLPPIDLLNGGTLGGTGGQPRHEVELQGGVFKNGLGFRLVTKWQSATSTLASSHANSLFFSDLATVDMTAFADLGEIPRWQNRNWARNFRVMVSVSNLFNSRIRARNGLGITPAGYEPAFLDPLGRTISFSIRKSV
ncbi:TonB-dependent receptor [Gluconobacter aidae]|uniref:TonB-dependent receptor plug domain-containing protein n=1 Tax=Gluconobacter aidae TaxID=2662454 RepID=A0A7X1VN33_9PROT|nr:TonB-dependent receptor plug domain-containing protein [Gluconobacter aidae]MQR98306.1 TonB-dependent receptor plug domain-containing protein [Gluconobacter aidae]